MPRQDVPEVGTQKETVDEGSTQLDDLKGVPQPKAVESVPETQAAEGNKELRNAATRSRSCISAVSEFGAAPRRGTQEETVAEGSKALDDLQDGAQPKAGENVPETQAAEGDKELHNVCI